jgi:catechol 2,3-dioxygenase-like lactoylglutathione lyase family enzyme
VKLKQGPGLAVQRRSSRTTNAFHVSNKEFDAIFGRTKTAGIVNGSAPWSADDGKVNDWGGGRSLYFKDPDGHLLELMTVSQ